MSDGYLIDTNVASELIRPRPDPHVVTWLESQEDLHVSVISLGELRRGFSLLAVGRRLAKLEDWFHDVLLSMVADRILPVTQSIADQWGMWSAERQRQGKPLTMADGLIAATAIEHGLTLVTRNVKDFADLSVAILNPWDRHALPSAEEV